MKSYYRKLTKPQLLVFLRDLTPLRISNLEHGIHHLVDAPANAITRLGEPLKKYKLAS